MGAISFLTTSCKSALAGKKSAEKALTHTIGYHDSADIGNYWTYARRYLLQDRMFANVPSWSPVVHNYLVSGWNATCTSPPPPAKPVCTTDIPGSNTSGTYIWSNITQLLNKPDPADPSIPPVSWRYYNGQCWDYECTATCSDDPRKCIIGSPSYNEFIFTRGALPASTDLPCTPQ